MLDPHYLGLGLGKKRDKAKQALHRKLSDSSSKSASKQSTQRAASALHVELSSLPSSSSATSSSGSAKKQHASPASSTHGGSGPDGGRSKSLAQRLPELEYFKQQTAMLKDFTPRTSDFFSKRRTSPTTTTDAGIPSRAPAIGSAVPATGVAIAKGSTAKRVVFPETAEELRDEPLPVRLGLAPPRRALIAPWDRKEEYKARVGYGYYFCIAPPEAVKFEGSSSSGSGSGSSRGGSTGTRPDQRRNTATSDASTSSSRYSHASGSLAGAIGPGPLSATQAVGTCSPALTPDSPLSLLSEWNSVSGADAAYSNKVFASTSGDRNRSNSLATPSPSSTMSRTMARSHAAAVPSGSLQPSLVNGNSRSTPGTSHPFESPLPSSSSSHCWHPSEYFVTWHSRCKGEIREFKHHAFRRSKVPYWLGYDAEAIEGELGIHLSTYFALQRSHILRPFAEDARPLRVLDLGCGAGAWCLDLAREWPQTEFVGLDVCPVQTPLAPMNDPKLEARVSWVVANFLETLPFPDGSFDFVHMRYLHQAIPEDKWSDVMTEVERVLAPGGQVELLESNHAFVGRVEMVDAAELFDLEHGRASIRPKVPQPIRGASPPVDAYNVDAIQIVIERMMMRRFFNFNPLSVIPSMLLTQGLADVAIGNPRHIPLYAESTRQRALARASRSVSGSASPSSSDNDEKWKEKFTNRSQIGKPLNSTFHIQDADVFRAFGTLHIAHKFSSGREMLWLEAEEEKRQVLRVHAHPSSGVSPTERPDYDGQKTFNQAHPAALKPYVHPWRSKADFFKDMDAWVEDLVARADVEGLVEKYLGWSHGHEELTVEGRKQAERQKKLNVAALLPVGQAEEAAAAMANGKAAATANAEGQKPALQKGGRPGRGDPDDADSMGRFSPLGFSVAASQPSHEAPGRLQTTRSTSKGQADDEDEEELLEDGLRGGSTSKARGSDCRTRKESRTSDGKRRKPVRPSSSGGMAIGFGAPRPFGRAAPLGEANLYGNLLSAGGPTRNLALDAPLVAVAKTPSQRAAAEFGRNKSVSGSQGSVKSGSSASTGRTSAEKEKRIGSMSVAKQPAQPQQRDAKEADSLSAPSGGDSSSGSPEAEETGAKTHRSASTQITLSDPSALLIRPSRDDPSQHPSSPPSSLVSSSSSPNKEKIKASNVFNIPPASPPTSPHTNDDAARRSPSLGGRSGSTPGTAWLGMGLGRSQNSSVTTLVAEPTALPALTLPNAAMGSGQDAEPGSGDGAKAEKADPTSRRKEREGRETGDSAEKGKDGDRNKQLTKGRDKDRESQKEKEREDPKPASVRKRKAQVALLGFFDTTGYWASAT